MVGLLSIEKGKDLLEISNWKKKNYPILTSRSVEGVRSSGIRRVHFDIDGEPVLDVTEELDLKEEYRSIRTKLIVK